MGDVEEDRCRAHPEGHDEQLRDALALSPIGGAHMLFADRKGDRPEAIGKLVNAIIADVVQRRLL
ncbi:hypothetical protein [Nonomuraea sp. B19D2]|uniref:hypothetical protein n=1 Tax=Nonomuraea sp. B19D2 TaxID=3159561 RepID=UPI0032DAAF93